MSCHTPSARVRKRERDRHEAGFRVVSRIDLYPESSFGSPLYSCFNEWHQRLLGLHRANYTRLPSWQTSFEGTSEHRHGPQRHINELATAIVVVETKTGIYCHVEVVDALSTPGTVS